MSYFRPIKHIHQSFLSTGMYSLGFLVFFWIIKPNAPCLTRKRFLSSYPLSSCLHMHFLLSRFTLRSRNWSSSATFTNWSHRHWGEGWGTTAPMQVTATTPDWEIDVTSPPRGTSLASSPPKGTSLASAITKITKTSGLETWQRRVGRENEGDRNPI